ncbi:hypothetical protein HNI00_03665 [Thermoleptolyngbya oregonensis NK1-22]|uniref:Uncharacterized protein n=1 Tax=Thermoleptolyngbya oregonensis NK1-22 TaxID=2547457 RepID=A0AA97BC89_9CYAN|nr:hypothetical protein [Thermoleptolyngbya oregonensis]WOB42356.1 hypothetical protein HNI00_03665 [Thermoleptolyngbya oregonensis NK1-22]
MFLDRYRLHWRLLRAETNRVGAEVEQWSYEQLDQDAENQPPLERQVEAVPVIFQIDRCDRLPNQDLCICIDAKSKLPTGFGIKPSYRFFKRRDGSVYY